MRDRFIGVDSGRLIRCAKLSNYGDVSSRLDESRLLRALQEKVDRRAARQVLPDALMLRFDCREQQPALPEMQYVEVKSSSVAQTACDLELLDCRSCGCPGPDPVAVAGASLARSSGVALSLRRHFEHLVRWNWAGMLTTVLSALAFYYCFLPPIYSLGAKPEEMPRLVIFIVSALFVGHLALPRETLPNRSGGRGMNCEKKLESYRAPTRHWKRRAASANQLKNRCDAARAICGSAKAQSHGQLGVHTWQGEIRYLSEECYRVLV